MDTAPTSPREPTPRAPSQEAWDALSEAERAKVVEGLSSYIPDWELASEGDPHFDAKADCKDMLRRYFQRTGRRIYVGSEVAVYYPAEERFAPDLMAVVDVDPHPRDRWVVSAEGRGLDWVLEVTVKGDRRKDLERNVRRYAALGVAEYFIADLPRKTLQGWRLAAPGVRTYERIAPQGGWCASRVLGLDVALQSQRVRFRQGTAALLAADEIIAFLEERVDDITEEAATRVEDAEARAATATARAVLAVLEARRVAVTDDARARILGCTDGDALARWLRNAATATALDAVFA